jgi:quercetin dioxygenase-like cupin family protein
MTTPSVRLHDYLPARFNSAATRHWVPSSTPGKSSSPLRFFADDRGFVELLRMEPGTVMPLHRHSGEIHAYNITGTRKLCTGELIGPGDYVYEPPGNTDWWKIVGDEPMLALVIVMGTVEFLGPGGVISGRASASTQLAEYERYCREHGLAMHDLLDR